MEALFPWWLRQRKRMWRIILAHTNLYLEMTHSTSPHISLDEASRIFTPYVKGGREMWCYHVPRERERERENTNNCKQPWQPPWVIRGSTWAYFWLRVTRHLPEVAKTRGRFIYLFIWILEERRVYCEATRDEVVYALKNTGLPEVFWQIIFKGQFRRVGVVCRVQNQLCTVLRLADGEAAGWITEVNIISP